MGSNISLRGRRPASPATRHVLDGVRRIVQALRESSRLAQAHAGLSGAQLFVLRTVAESPNLSLNELAERTRTHQSSVSAVVARLASDRLLRKRTAEGDARRVEISLSPGGRRKLDRAPETAQERLVAAVDALPAVERIQLAATLDILVRGMSLPLEPAHMFFEEPAKRNASRGTGRLHV